VFEKKHVLGLMARIPARFCNAHRTGLTESIVDDKLKFSGPLAPMAWAVFLFARRFLRKELAI
jgi:hypothetical protein